MAELKSRYGRYTKEQYALLADMLDKWVCDLKPSERLVRDVLYADICLPVISALREGKEADIRVSLVSARLQKAYQAIFSRETDYMLHILSEEDEFQSVIAQWRFQIER